MALLLGMLNLALCDLFILPRTRAVALELELGGMQT